MAACKGEGGVLSAQYILFNSYNLRQELLPSFTCEGTNTHSV